MSQSSKTSADPLSEILAGLGVEATRVTRLEAGGDWALTFPPLDRLKFVAVLMGQCWLLREDHPPVALQAGDLVLIGRTDYAVASDPSIRPFDGGPFYDHADQARLGAGDEAVLLGGGVVFTAATAVFVLDMLPSCMRMAASEAGRLQSLLILLDQEARQGAPGKGAAIRRLAELLVIEAIRGQLRGDAEPQTGWLGALSDPRLARALSAFHSDIAAHWTVHDLAAAAGMSRAGFAAAFRAVTGRSPMAYVRSWRLSLAQARLAAGQTIAITAAEVGYGSTSAFGHAYRQWFGYSPKTPAD